MIRYLLDTNVVSETRKRRPSQRVTDFINETEADQRHLSALTIGELHRGVVLVRDHDPLAAREIDAWIRGIESEFAGRVLQVDAETARAWAEIAVGPTKPTVDLMLVATAIRHGLTLVTRNVRHMTGFGVPLINPWNA